MPNPALEPGEPEIPLPGVAAWNPDQTLEKLGPVAHEPFEASGPITQLDTGSPGVGP